MAKANKATKAKRLVIDKSDAERVALRDYFAAMAMSGLMANPSARGSWADRAADNKFVPTIDRWRKAAAEGAYEYADAMLAARGHA
jgi:hypothetical protein